MILASFMQEARVELRAIRSGDRRFNSLADRRQAEANLVARLQGLGFQV